MRSKNLQTNALNLQKFPTKHPSLRPLQTFLPHEKSRLPNEFLEPRSNTSTLSNLSTMKTKKENEEKNNKRLRRTIFLLALLKGELKNMKIKIHLLSFA